MKNNLKKKRIIIFLAVFFILILPALLIVISATWLGRTWVRPEVAEEERAAEHLTPKEILTSKSQYKDDFVAIRGRVLMADMVCAKKECPESDPCCGCENERDLLLVDAGTSVLGKQEGRLRLLDKEKQPFCQRQTNSCEYQCPGWQVGEVYEVRGYFRTEPPPRGSGLKIYLDYYLEVEGSRVVGSLSLTEKLKTFFGDLRELIKQGKSGGYYILH